MIKNKHMNAERKAYIGAEHENTVFFDADILHTVHYLRRLQGLHSKFMLLT